MAHATPELTPMPSGSLDAAPRLSASSGASGSMASFGTNRRGSGGRAPNGGGFVLERKRAASPVGATMPPPERRRASSPAVAPIMPPSFQNGDAERKYGGGSGPSNEVDSDLVHLEMSSRFSLAGGSSPRGSTAHTLPTGARTRSVSGSTSGPSAAVASLPPWLASRASFVEEEPLSPYPYALAAGLGQALPDQDEEVLAVPVSSFPPACSGAKGLKVPPLIRGHVSSVTLPSRLALLGRKGFRVLASLRPLYVGNSVLGYAHVWNKDFSLELFLLPWIFSKAAARMALFVRAMILLVLILIGVAIFDVQSFNVGKLWVVGSALSLFSMYKLSQFRRAADGVMAFCRSMGAPETEEYMFSYSWSVEAENVRTLAKALWDTGIGVWIDTVKLTPGDEIRPMVRTMVRRVARVVVFLSPAYVASPNCAVEFVEALQSPAKTLVCVLQAVDPSLIEFMEDTGVAIVYGLPALIEALDAEVQDMQNQRALDWWRAQKIAGAGVPSNVVPSAWPIPRFSLTGRLVLGEKSLTVGPVFLAGDCKDSGTCVALPTLFFAAALAVAISVWDLYHKYSNTSTADFPGDESNKLAETGRKHSNFDLAWLTLIALCNSIPLLAWGNLFETRRALHVALKPLLASKSLGGGVKVRIVGSQQDPIVQNLRKFLQLIAHEALEFAQMTVVKAVAHIRDNEAALNGLKESALAAGDHQGAAALHAKFDGLRGQGREQVVTVYVMDSISARDSLFGAEPFAFDRFSLFVWTGAGDCFTPDEVGKKLMRFLVLVARWDKKMLAENLFSAVGVRVVDILHS